jgi:quercetin dioxygenase-like cupin family protein
MDGKGASVRRWPAGHEEPTESALRSLLAEEGLEPYRWSNGPGDIYPAHEHAYDKVIYVVAGSIVFQLPDEQVELRPGDRLDLARGVRHHASVGGQGVVCLEAHRR